MNRVIIAGSRDITNYSYLEEAIADSNFRIDEVVCGCARGVDEMGKIWAEKHEVPVKLFPAKWNDFTVTPCHIKIRWDGAKYNSWAGHNRNKEMAQYSTHLILIHNNSSSSLSMRKLAKEYDLTIFEKIVS